MGAGAAGQSRHAQHECCSAGLGGINHGDDDPDRPVLRSPGSCRVHNRDASEVVVVVVSRVWLACPALGRPLLTKGTCVVPFPFFFVVVFENSSQILTWAVGLDVYKANTRDERPPMIGPWPSRLRSGGDTCMIHCHCSLNQALA